MTHACGSNTQASIAGYEFEAEIGDNPKATDPSRGLNIEPEFLDGDGLVVGGKSMRIYRIENLLEHQIRLGESWLTRVERTIVNAGTPLTRDGRTKVFVYVRLLERIERFFDPCRRREGDGWVIERAKWSGSRLLGYERIPASEREVVYKLADRGVVKVSECSGGEVTLYDPFPKIITRNDYLNELRGQFKKLSLASLTSMLDDLPQAPPDLLKIVGRRMS